MTKHSTLTPEAFARRSEAASAAVASALTALAESAAASYRSDDLFARLEVLARAEVIRDQEAMAAYLAEQLGLGPAEALALVAAEAVRQVVITGADDSWSGRGNDLRRVRHDALRRWVADNADLGDD